MGRGQRHSKNAGVMGSEGLSYSERRGLGHGTVKERFGKEALGRYYDCCLTLTRAVDPVVTPDGYLFSREAILENLLAQKKGLRKRLATWEASQQETCKKAADKETVARQAALIAFDRANHMGISQKTADAIKGAIVDSAAAALGPQTASSVIAIKEQEERAKTSKAFWMPGSVHDAAVVVEKPDMETRCPACNKPLKMKDLVPVKFTDVPDSPEGLHMDPVSKDVFTAATKLVVLKPTGDVVAAETWHKVIKPDGTYQGHKMTDADVIELKTGGTGFCARDGDKVMGQKRFVLGPGSGRQDLRGQSGGARSLGGLVFMN